MSPVINNKIPTGATASATTKEPDYFFLYGKSFLGFEPPMNILLFCVAPVVVYLFLVFVVFPALAPRNPESVKTFATLRYWHNISMFLFSLVCFVVAVYEMYIAKEFGFVSLKLEDMMPMLCDEASQNLKNWYYVFVVSKLYEWLDTAFLVWLKNDYARSILSSGKKDKKQVGGGAGAIESSRKTTEQQTATAELSRKTASVAAVTSADAGKAPAELNFLHLYHHATTFVLYLMMMNLPGMMKNGILLNSFVHTLMYLHYARPLPMPFLITITQIVQLGFGTWIWYLGFHPETGCPAHKNFIKNHWLDYLSPWSMAPVYLGFFIKFFIQRFIIKALFGGKGNKKNEARKEE